MKKLFISLLIAVSFFYLNATSFAQAKLKIGYIDSNELLTSMPARDSAKTVLEAHSKTLENQLTAMNSEFEKKYQDFQATQATLSELIKQTKANELQELKTRIENFQQSAQKDLQDKEAELLNPIVAKAKKAIEEVAKENSFTYVFDVATGSLLFYEAGENILPLVKKKLGL